MRAKTLLASAFIVLLGNLSGNAAHASCGEASWYGPGLYGNLTANGEVLRRGTMTAAHRTLPMGSWVRVRNRSNGRAVSVRINDRGPYVSGRIIDLSSAAARALRIDGIADVCISRIY